MSTENKAGVFGRIFWRNKKEKPSAAVMGGSVIWNGSSAWGKNILPVVGFGGGSYSGKTVTDSSVLRLSAAWACIRLLAETVSTLPIKVYRRLPDGTRVEAKDHYLYKLLCVEPNKYQTPSKLMEFLVASIQLRGNSYYEKRVIGSRVVGLNPIVPSSLNSIELQDDGGYIYKFMRNGNMVELGEDSIWHVRGFSCDGMLGIDPISAGANVFGGSAAADEVAGKTFAGGMSASGMLMHKNGILQQAQREMLSQTLEKFYGSNNAGKVMVLEAGLEYQSISLNPESAQLLETRQFSVEEICRWFRVPPYMIGHMDKSSSWGSSVEGQQLNFLTNTLRPLLVNIEQSITQSLIAPEERGTIHAEFCVEGLLRGNSKERAEYYNSGLDHGWMSRNEVRAKENLPPIEGGDVFTVQSALIDINKVGENYVQK